jgi:hypothetical protein
MMGESTSSPRGRGNKSDIDIGAVAQENGPALILGSIAVGH